MTQSIHPPRRATSVVLGLIVALAAATAPSFVHAQGCSAGSPAAEPPSSLWGSFEPAAIMTDSTRYTGQQRSDSNLPIHTYLDVENGYLFVSFFSGFGIWDARGNKAEDPQLLSAVDGWKGGFLVFAGSGEFKDMVFGIDAPAGDDTIVAVGARSPVGLSIWDTSNKSTPRQVYQDHTTRYIDQVYAATIGGRQYAFGADGSGQPGLHVYDMTAARQANGCVENTAGGEKSCGVYKGTVGSRGVRYVDGVGVGSKHYVATGAALLSPRGVEVWDVSNPLSPQFVDSALNNRVTYGVAMWTHGGRTYLATRTEVAKGFPKEQAVFFELVNGSLDQIAAIDLPSSGSSVDWKSVTFSRSGTTPFVHFGDNLLCAEGAPSSLRHESLFDVTKPSAPKEVSPTATIAHPKDKNLQVDYWSWYYSTLNAGYSHVSPRVGKFNGPVFYRAASSLLDAHVWNGSPDQPPAASFAWNPQTAYPGDAITFTDTSSGAVVARDWTFPDGTPGTSTATAPVVSFDSPGSKNVSLTVSNPALAASDNVVRPVTILDPAPQVGSVTANVASTFVCGQVSFTANDVTGKAPLSYGWEVQQNGEGLVPAVTGSGNPFVWNTAGVPAGTYSAVVTVNGTGAPATKSASVTLQALPTLPTSFAPTNDPFAAGTVQFHANVPGATEWSWDFEGDGTWGPWIQDPVAGPNPVHTYATTGTRTVKVRVRNCQQTTAVVSTGLTVDVEQVAPLEIVEFKANGCVIFCDFFIGDTVQFNQEVTGDPTSYEYDWEGDGTFVNSATPILTHTYAAAGHYTPVMRVRRGTETTTKVHGAITVSKKTITPPPTPSISIGGGSSVAVDTNITLTASAFNCSPSPTGWTWTSNGATITGSGASVAVKWASAGTKSVRATNSACGGAQGLKTVNVTSGGPPPDERPSVQAAFTFSPVAPESGHAVHFDASASSGSPTSYSWDFGDGQLASGVVVNHTFANPGSYDVKLTVEKASTDPGCNVGVCQAEKHSTTKKVTVVAGGPTCPEGKLCLMDGQFEVEVDWDDERNDRTGVGIPQGYTDNTGFFTFFNPDNVELIVKVLDGGPVNGNWWLFYGGVSDVEYTLRVTDKTVTPHRVKTYRNLQGTICGVGDNVAFPKVGTSPAESTAITGATHGGGDTGGTGGTETLVLQDRFHVTVDWNDHRNGITGAGTSVPGTSKTGYFWFFRPENLELVVKMLDGRAVNGHWWVLWGGLSDVEYDLRIEDTVTGHVWEHHNVPGNLCGGSDTTAFAEAN